MKTWTVAAALLFVGAYGVAQAPESAPAARKSCDDLKAEIAKKLDAKGVTGYSLDACRQGQGRRWQSGWNLRWWDEEPRLQQDGCSTS